MREGAAEAIKAAPFLFKKTMECFYVDKNKANAETTDGNGRVRLNGNGSRM